MRLPDFRRDTRPAPSLTAVRDTDSRLVHARRPRNNMDVMLEEGRVYRLTARGKWTDGPNFLCDADGYMSNKRILRAFEGQRREPAARWFALVGRTEGGALYQFVIETEATIIPPSQWRGGLLRQPRMLHVLEQCRDGYAHGHRGAVSTT